MMIRVKLESIQMDASIQCRAEINTGVVNEYAERMLAGDKFPPVDLFGTAAKNWIGDGWHRLDAARSIGAKTIAATLHKGGRVDALKHALGANALHGHRRSNADKRRCVEIALAEFPKLSSRSIAEMCGVSDPFVSSLRPEALQTVSNATRTTSDGRQYPARRKGAEEGRDDEHEAPARPVGPSSLGMEFAIMAISQLEQIDADDTERKAALDKVEEWINEHR